MQMTDGEILTSWKQAKDQKAQLGILADLNAVSVKTMREKLLEMGAENVPAARKGNNRHAARIDELRAMELYNQGLCDLDIAETCGVSVVTVQNWRKMMRLKVNRKKPVPKPKATVEKTTGLGAPKSSRPTQDRTGQDRTGQDRRADLWERRCLWKSA